MSWSTIGPKVISGDENVDGCPPNVRVDRIRIPGLEKDVRDLHGSSGPPSAAHFDEYRRPLYWMYAVDEGALKSHWTYAQPL